MKKIILVLSVLVFGSALFAEEGILNKIRTNAFNSAIEATEAGKNRKSAYEEYLENKVAEEDRTWKENCDILEGVAIRYPVDMNKWVKVYCYPMHDYIWYTAFIGDNNNMYVNLAYDADDDIGELFYASENISKTFIKTQDDLSDKVMAGIILTNKSDKIVIIQDINDPYCFAISW
jgi:nuclear transport factor 2 (NTF2) superfamily protein